MDDDSCKVSCCIISVIFGKKAEDVEQKESSYQGRIGFKVPKLKNIDHDTMIVIESGGFDHTERRKVQLFSLIV